MVTVIIENGVEHQYATQQYKSGLYCIVDNDPAQQLCLDIKEEDFHRELRQQYQYNTSKSSIIESETFTISELSRETLKDLGYDAANVPNEIMKELASRLNDDYFDQMFRSSLDAIAEYLNIPKKE